MSVRSEGFLSEETRRAVPNIRKRHGEWFALAEELNRFCQEILMKSIPRMEGRKDEIVYRRELAASPLYARCVSGFQGIVILGERGMYLEAKCISRWILEATFILAALGTDTAFVDEYVDQEKRERDNFARKFRELSSITSFEPDVIKQMDEEQRKLTEELVNVSKRRLSTRDIAERGGMLGHYLSRYALLSQTVHNGLRDLDCHYIATANGDLGNLRWAPGVEQLGDLLSEVSGTLFIATSRAMMIFGLDHDGDRKGRFDALWAHWKSINELAGS